MQLFFQMKRVLYLKGLPVIMEVDSKVMVIFMFVLEVRKS